MTAQRIWQDLTEEFGYGHSYESVERYLRTIAPRDRTDGVFESDQARKARLISFVARRRRGGGRPPHFTEFSGGLSAKAIAKRLNRERTPGPMGAAWSPSTIHGHAGRGTGILNNELYIGRRVWNRLRYLTNPETGTRVSRPNPPSTWITKDVPELRIIDDELWQAVKARQAQIRRVHTTGFVRLRDPKYLFSGLTKCGVCGGGYVLSSHSRLVCFNARNRGTCANTRTITRQEVEARVLTALRERLMDPTRFARICARFTQTVNRLHRDQRGQLAGAKRDLNRVNQEIQKVIAAIKDGCAGPELKAEMDALQDRKVDLTRQLAAPPRPALHPSMAETFRAKVTALCAGLADDGERPVARQALRGIVEAIVIPADSEGLLQVRGNLGAMLAMAQGRRLTSLDPVAIAGCGGLQPPIPPSLYIVAA
jgi:hypothetical protein